MLFVFRFILACTLLLTACGRTNFEGLTMGTTWSLKTARPSPTNLGSDIQVQLDHYEAMLSNWRADSPISCFNASRCTDWQPMPPEVIEIVEAANRIADETGGALDITLGPLINLWGFGAPGPHAHPPSTEDIQIAQSHGGWSQLEWREEPPALRKMHPKLEINLSSLVEGTPWRVGVQTPNAPAGDLMQTLPLTNAALATSGTYRQHFEHAGITYTHVLDPHTGHPVSHNLRAVTVMHENAMLADAYATALLVLGPRMGREAAKNLGLRVIWIE